ncbi:MAG: MFS transporter [Chloroflexi bacterium]|nr:MFS transporter [Chloroflexota bacterium]
MQHPVFRRVMGASVAGHMVRFTDFTISAWLVVQQTDSAFAVGLIVFFRVIPWLVLGPVVGIILDRYSRVRVYRLTQLGMAISTAGFSVALFSGQDSLPVIYAYTMLMGALLMVEISARRAYMSGVVGPRALGTALGLDMVSLNAAWFIGSNLGGTVVNFLDPFIAYSIVSAVFAANYLVLRGLPSMLRPSPAGPPESPYRAITAGYKFARANPAIFAGLLVVGVNNFFGYAFESMAPAFARDIYRAGPTGFGLIMSAQGLGALTTALYISLGGRRIVNPGRLLIIAAMTQAVASIGFSFTQSVGIGFVAIAVLGMISTVFAITHTMLILLSTPANFRGRIMGFQVLMMGLYPIGSLSLGITGDAIGLGSAVRLFALTGLGLLTLILLKYPELRTPVGQTASSTS